MRNHRLDAVRIIVATALATFTLGAYAQAIGSQEQASIDLPRRGAERWPTAASTTP